MYNISARILTTDEVKEKGMDPYKDMCISHHTFDNYLSGVCSKRIYKVDAVDSNKKWYRSRDFLGFSISHDYLVFE